MPVKWPVDVLTVRLAEQLGSLWQPRAKVVRETNRVSFIVTGEGAHQGA